MRNRTTELRDYRIAPGRLQEFVAAWLDSVVPLRRAHGYRVEGAWTIPGEDRFVWLLSLDVPADEWEARNAAYYDDPRRQAFDPDPADLITQASHAIIQPVPLPPER